MSLTEQVASLRPEQRARIDWVRVSRDRATLTWMGMGEVVDPDSYLIAPVPEGVTVSAWIKPEPLQLALGPGLDPEFELGDLAHSGILGDMVVERITAPDEVRWRAQAWVGSSKALAIADESSAMAWVLAADADLRLARWRLKQAEAEVQSRVTEALAAGKSAVQVGNALGVTRARVYQIRDGGR